MVICSYIIGFFTINYDNPITHEDIHKINGRYAGCINYTVETTIFNGGSYTCHDYEDRTEEMRILQKQNDFLNEIVSYNLNTLMKMLILCSAIPSVLLLALLFQLSLTENR